MPTSQHAEDEFRWHVSSHSANTSGNCVEVGPGGATVGLRDSKDRDGGAITVRRDTFTALVRAVRRGELGR